MPIRYLRTVQQKMTGVIFLVSAVVLLLTSLQFGFVGFKRLENEARKDTRAITSLVVASARFPMALRDVNGAANILNALEERDEVVSAYLVLPNGRTIAGYSRSRSGHARQGTGEQLRILNLESQQLAEGLKRNAESFWEQDGMFATFTPIDYEGTPVGYLYLNYEPGDLHIEQLQLLLGWLISMGIAVALTYFLSARLQRGISRPIEQLATRMKEIASEKRLYGFRPQENQDEFGLLFQGFEEMINALKERDWRLEEQRSSLEAEVMERTRELSAAKDKAEQATLAKSRFLANMSHEIRTPMIGVLGMAELLREKPLSDEDRGMVTTIFRSGEALLAILNDILDVSKIEAGRLNISTQPVNLIQLCKDVIGLMRVNALEKGVALTFEQLGDLPIVEADTGRVRQILLNLVGNAVKFTDHGTVAVVLSGLCNQTENLCDCQIIVRDTGIGIAPEEREQVFAPFSQADVSTTRRYGGTGLGLSIVRELVQLMGGTIALDSEPGAGCVFTVHLPLVVASQDSLDRSAEDREKVDLSLPPPLAARVQTGVNGSRGCVLVVEDNQTTQELLAILLRQMNCDSVMVVNGQQAIDYLAVNQVDLVLMDCQMPMMDGYEATTRLRAHGVAVPIVALTAHAGAEVEGRCFAAGMNDFLCKPFRQADLRIVLDRWLTDVAPAGCVTSAESSG